MTKQAILFSILVLSSVFGFTQGSITNPVNWTTTVEKNDDGTYLLSFKANLAKSWHIYSQEQESDDGPLPTEFTFEKNKDIELLGKIKEIGDLEVKYEDVFEMNIRQYAGAVEFQQQIKVKSEKATFKVDLLYMVCTDVDGKCIPFDKTFRVDLDKKKMTVL